MVLGKDISMGCYSEVMIPVIPYNFHKRGTLILLQIVQPTVMGLAEWCNATR